MNTVNSFYYGHPQDCELVSIIVGYYFSQMFVIYFCWGFSCCLYYWGVHNSGVSARRELTVDCKNNGVLDPNKNPVRVVNLQQNAQI